MVNFGTDLVVMGGHSNGSFSSAFYQLSSENGKLIVNVHDAESLKSSLSEIGHYYTAPASSNDLATRPESMQELNQKPLDLRLRSDSFSNIQVLPGKIRITSALSYKSVMFYFSECQSFKTTLTYFQMKLTMH